MTEPTAEVYIPTYDVEKLKQGHEVLGFSYQNAGYTFKLQIPFAWVLKAYMDGTVTILRPKSAYE